MNQTIKRYEELLEITASLSTQELLEYFKIKANRHATMMFATGSTRLQEGDFLLPEELAIIKKGINQEIYELL